MGLSTDPEFPAIARRMRVGFGDTVFQLDFRDAEHMSFIGLEGPLKGAADTVRYTAVKIREQVFMVYWHEPSTGANVVHVEDFEQGILHTNIAGADGTFVNMRGYLLLEAS